MGPMYCWASPVTDLLQMCPINIRGSSRYRYASERPHQYMREPRDERMTAIERQLDILIQNQLQQTQLQNPMQNQQEKTHFSIQLE